MSNTIWYEELGYAYNPFTIKPGFFDDEVVGYDKDVEALVKKLSGHTMVFLEGEYGQGKTTILKYLVNEFSGKNKVIYISRNRSDRAMNYTQLLKGAKKGLGKLFGSKAKDAILIVDETAKINAGDCSQIEEYFDKGNFKSVLFIDKSLTESRLTDSVKKLIGKDVVKLPTIAPKDAVELVRSRLDGNEKLITDDQIKKVFDKSKKNTRQFLLNMEDVCRHAIENGRVKVGDADMKVL